MKISRLLAAHRQFESLGLSGSFGDGYLMKHNSVYRSVRRAALQHGFRFSGERNEAYETLPLLQLESILASKVLPFARNTAAFEQMSPASLALLEYEDIDGNLKKNFVLHEAAHAVARALAGKILVAGAHGLEGQRRRALKSLLEESCANVAELMAMCEVHDNIHRAFFALNSYMGEFESRSHINTAVEQIGCSIVIKFMLLSYLESNFLGESLSDKRLNQIMAVVSEGQKLGVSQLRVLRGLAKIAFRLNPRFREQTTAFYLRLGGVDVSPQRLFDFDFVRVLVEDSEFAEFLNQYVGILEI